MIQKAAEFYISLRWNLSDTQAHYYEEDFCLNTKVLKQVTKRLVQSLTQICHTFQLQFLINASKIVMYLCV